MKYKLVLWPQPNNDGKHTVFLRITHNRRCRYFSLQRYCLPEQWNNDPGRLKKNYKGYGAENEVLQAIEARAAKVIRDFEMSGEQFTLDKFEARMFRQSDSVNLSEYIAAIAADQRGEGREGTANVYKSVASQVEQFRPSATLADLEPSWCEQWERWLRRRGVEDGGLKTYFAILRAVCNRAIKEGRCSADWSPFRLGGYILKRGKQKRGKLALPLADIRRLESAKTESDVERLALDLFLFSFYCRGINLADIARLTPDSIKAGRVEYVRQKTGVFYSVALNEKSAAILSKYAGGRWCFPVLTDRQKTERQRHIRVGSFAENVNDALRAIAGRVGIGEYVTFYTARHSYATALKNAGVSREVIREAMGHSDAKITDAYLTAFDAAVLDEADRVLLN